MVLRNFLILLKWNVMDKLQTYTLSVNKMYFYCFIWFFHYNQVSIVIKKTQCDDYSVRITTEAQVRVGTYLDISRQF